VCGGVGMLKVRGRNISKGMDMDGRLYTWESQKTAD
jgi:hypothetical protein